MIVKEKNGEGFLDLRICDNLELMAEIKDNFIGCDINPNCFEKAKERGLFSFTDLPTNVDKMHGLSLAYNGKRLCEVWEIGEHLLNQTQK